MSLASRYTIMRKIADGGTAEIFLAKQHGAQGFEKMVVLKRIFTTFYADPQFRHMLVDEAHVAMTLNHSNIVQVLDLGESEGRYFLAMELVDGWTLDRILRRAKAAGVPFPPALALYLTAEICRALAYAHGKARPDGMSMGIVHRDMSPHNVLVSEQGEIKITDFGIAKAHTRQGEGREQSVKNLIKGKIAFMSPEQASAGELDARSDLFSVGTMLYVMITRRHPFDAPTDYETLMLVKSGDYMPPETARPGLNPELYRVIRKAMALPEGRRDAGGRRAGHAARVPARGPDRAAALVGGSDRQGRRADADARGAAGTHGLSVDGGTAARGRRTGIRAGPRPWRCRRGERRQAAAAGSRANRADDAPAAVRASGHAASEAPRGADCGHRSAAGHRRLLGAGDGRR
jgi:serine/threonine-protein kinase